MGLHGGKKKSGLPNEEWLNTFYDQLNFLRPENTLFELVFNTALQIVPLLPVIPVKPTLFLSILWKPSFRLFADNEALSWWFRGYFYFP